MLVRPPSSGMKFIENVSKFTSLDFLYIFLNYRQSLVNSPQLITHIHNFLAMLTSVAKYR
jgi:hypothetical protein